MSFKVLVGEFSQESNSFSPFTWDVSRFRSMLLCGGTAMKVVYRVFRSPVKGMLDAVREGGGRPVCGFAMRAISGGPVSDEAVSLFTDRMTAAIEKKGPFDAVLISLHGATIGISHEDACGHIVEEIRKKAGKKAVIALALDLHANVTGRMEREADFVCGFRTYPHTDLYETGLRAGRLAMRALKGEKLRQSFARFPMIVPASGYTTAAGRFREIMNEGYRLQREGRAEDFSIFMMQPWLDVEDAQSCVTIVSREDESAEAGRIASLVYDARRSFHPETSSPEEVRKAVSHREKGKPVIWAEPADSPNAGAVGDSVELLKEILSWNSGIRAATTVMDPEAVALAKRTGAGNEAEFVLGAKHTPGMGDPLTLKCRVKSLHRGLFFMAGPMAKGAPISIGPSAVLRSGGVDILVCERPGGTGDVNYYRHFGMNPADYDLVVVKANTSFRECYRDIADSIFVADTYGAASGNLKSLPFKKIDKTRFYPFNEP